MLQVTRSFLRCPQSQHIRQLSTTAFLAARKNPRKWRKTLLDIPKYLKPMFDGKLEYEYPAGLYGTGERPIGIKTYSGEFVKIPEMIPELVVPDLTGFKLKPYVSFKVKTIVEPEMSARDLFDAVYGQDIKKEFDAGKLNDEVKELEEKATNGQLKRHTYDLDPPRMIDTATVRVK